MRQLGLRWGLTFGVAGAVLGVLTLLIGKVFVPVPASGTAETVVVAVFIQGLLALVALGVVFGMAYYAGLRTERDKLLADSTEATPALGAPEDRSGSIFAGGLVMLCYWFVTTLYLWLQPTVAPGPQAQRPDVGQFLESRLIFGVVCLIFGIGLGGLGGRAPAARRLLDRIAVTPAAAPVASPLVAAPSAPTPAQQEVSTLPLGDETAASTTDASAHE